MTVFVICILLSSAIAQANRLVIFNDAWHKQSTEIDAPCVDLAIALHDKVAPVLVSGSILYALLHNAINQNNITDQYDKAFFYSWHFNPKHFTIAHINDTSYFLLIPNTHQTWLQAFDTTATTISTENSIKKLFTFVKYHVKRPTDLDNCLKIIFNNQMPHRWSFIIAGHGSPNDSIAGLNLDQMRKALIFLSNPQPRLVLIKSCGAAGINQNLITTELAARINYPIALTNIQEANTVSKTKPLNEPRDNSSDFVSFFTTLEKYPTQSSHGLEDALTYYTVINNWYLSANGINNIPQVYMPEIGWTLVYTSLPHFMHITEPFLARHELDEQPIVITDTHALLVSPLIVSNNVTIEPKATSQEPLWINTQWKNYRIGTMQKNISLYNDSDYHESNPHNYYFPTFLSPSTGPHRHVFASITINNGGCIKFLRDACMNIQGRTQPVCWLIKKLIGANDFQLILSPQSQKSCPELNALNIRNKIELTDIIICSYNNMHSDPVIKLLFTHNEQDYYLESTVLNKKKHKVAWNIAPISEEERNQLIRSIENKTFIPDGIMKTNTDETIDDLLMHADLNDKYSDVRSSLNSKRASPRTTPFTPTMSDRDHAMTPITAFPSQDDQDSNNTMKK